LPAAEANGRAFLGIIRQIKDGAPGAALEQIVEAAGPATQKVFREPIRVMSWYPYPAFAAFLRAVDRRLGKGDGQLCRALGTNAGARDLGTIFRIYRALASPERLIRACNKVWPSYYRNAGRMEAITWGPQDTTLRIFDFPEMDRMHCRLMEGWMISTMGQIGVQIGPGARETECMGRGGAFHEFRCTWTK
jgi:hypothetical protein